MSFLLGKASKHQLKARIALIGPSGSGKTYTALEAAMALTGGNVEAIAVIDSERGSAALYADEFGEFMHGVLDPPYSAEAYIAAMQECINAGAQVIVIDSLSHAWSGQGGILEMVDDYASRQQGSAGKFGGWREATPKHNEMVDTIVRLPAHVIVTMRSKTAYEVDKDENNRVTVRKLGLQPEQRGGLEYEFDLVGDVDLEHRLVISKSRCSPYQDSVQVKADRGWFGDFVTWLNSGERSTPPHEEATFAAMEAGFDETDLTLIAKAYQPGALSIAALSPTNLAKLRSALAAPDKLAKLRAGVEGMRGAADHPDGTCDTPACAVCGGPLPPDSDEDTEEGSRAETRQDTDGDATSGGDGADSHDVGRASDEPDSPTDTPPGAESGPSPEAAPLVLCDDCNLPKDPDDHDCAVIAAYIATLSPEDLVEDGPAPDASTASAWVSDAQTFLAEIPATKPFAECPHDGPIDRIGIARTRCRTCGVTFGAHGPSGASTSSAPAAVDEGGEPPTDTSWRELAEASGVTPSSILVYVRREWPKNSNWDKPKKTADLDKVAATDQAYRINDAIDALAASAEAAAS